MSLSPDRTSSSRFRILSLDGGGALGFYTLGVLTEIEAMVGSALCESFDLVYGTSTGAIIAALISLGSRVNDIHDLYRRYVPYIMGRLTRHGRSRALARLAKTVFGTHTFEDAKCLLGIVATRSDFEAPIVFKGSPKQAHGRQSTFVPGFGCTLAEAIQASCSAYPYFQRSLISTKDNNQLDLIDGGYCANNPTLFAIADATGPLHVSRSTIRVVSIGVGGYPQSRNWRSWLQNSFPPFRLLKKTLSVNAASMEQLRAILYRDVDTVRINDIFDQHEMAADMMETDLRKLGMIYQRGRESFAKREADLKRMLSESRSLHAVAGSSGPNHDFG